MDETACLKELTTYKAYTLQKVPPPDTKEKASWARVDVQEERLAQEDLVKAINKLKSDKYDKHPKTVAEKKLALAPNQSTQVTNILDDLVARERDHNYEWTLTQMDSKTSKKNGIKQTDAMTIYFKRAPVKGANVISLYQQHIERQVQREQQDKMKEHERRQREQQMRAEQQFQEQQMREHRMREMQAQAQAQAQAHAHQQQQHHNAAGHQIISLDNDRGRRGRSRSRSRSRSRDRRRKSKNNRKSDKRYDSESDVYDSDSSYSTDYSSNDTSISSRRTRRSDKHHKKDKHSGKKASKYHRKQYYNGEVPRSPRAVLQDRFAVPEVPRPPIGVPQYDQVEAAYQAGLHDADVDHFALEKLKADRELIARERQAMYDSVPRHMPPLREDAYRTRTIVEGHMPLGRSLPRRLSAAGPRAVVSYGTDESIRRPVHPPRIYSESSRYLESRRDPRDYVDEDRLYGQERRAHEHIESRRADPTLGRRMSFYRRSPTYEPVIHQGHPFAPVRDDLYR